LLFRGGIGILVALEFFIHPKKARKTRALSIQWSSTSARCNPPELQLAADRIAYALRRDILDGELGKEDKKGSANDSLKAIHDLSNTLALRTQACHALGGFVLGSTSIPLFPIHTQVSRTVTTYLTTAVYSPGKKSQSPENPTEAAILRTLKSTLAEHTAQGPVWALSVLATFIVLLGSRISQDMHIYYQQNH